MEISALEISILSSRINESISGYSLSGAYSIEGGMLLRLRHETKQELLVAISSFAPWITTKNLALPQAENFVVRTREILERSRLVKVTQAARERITQFSFESRSGDKRSLYAEFFAGGNLILVDEKDGKEEIIEAKRPQNFRHRRIAPREKYELPPSRGLDLQDLTEDSLSTLLCNSLANEKSLTVIKWFGRSVGTSRKFVEEIFARSGVNVETPLESVTASEIKELVDASNDLKEMLKSSTRGYLLLPEAEKNDEVPDLDVCSFTPKAWFHLANEGSAKIREFETLSEALDEAQVESLVFGKRKKASKELRGKTRELEAAISKQDSLIEKNSSIAHRLRSLADELMMMVISPLNGQEEVREKEEVISNLQNWEIVEKEGEKYRFVTEPRSYLSSLLTPKSLASRLFEEAKKLEDQNGTISKVRKDLIRRKEELVTQTASFEERVEKRIELTRRPREWFERYRWFLTSDLRLAVGGKDSTSNSIMINKYTQSEDLVFHADLHGSPFFILKKGKTLLENETQEDDEQEKTISPEIEQELAQATVSFSRAWKDELGSADAFWVYPEQVKKSAPSGEYLPRGSFFIEGKKNFVKHMRVELSIGIMTQDKLARLSEESTARTPVVVCGPEKSLSKYCVASIKIAPGKEKSTSIAKRVKQILIGKVKEDGELKEMVKKLAIEEFIRVLPSGMYKVVAEKQNG